MAIEKPLFPSIDHKKIAEEEQWLSFFHTTQKNRQNTHKTYSTGLKFCRTANCYTELNELDQNCHSTVALTLMILV